MPVIAIYDWSQVTTPGTLAPSNLAGDTYANDPNSPGYVPGNPSWTDQTYTYNGGTPTQIVIDDDDTLFEDGYVETGAPATLRHDVVLNGTLYSAGSVVENEFSMVDGTGIAVWVVRINGENVGIAPQMPYTAIPAGSTFTPTEGRDGDAADSSEGISSTTSYANVICFAAQTRIDTPQGPRPAGALKPGDRVLTRDNDVQPLIWTCAMALSFDSRTDRRRPILIPAGAFGPDAPRRPVIVSPQHRVLVDMPAGPVLAPAKGLLGWRGIRVVRGRDRIVYVHLLCPRHDVLSADGLWCESLYPGPQALASLSPRDRATVMARLGLLPGQRPPPALPLLSVSDTLEMVRDQRAGHAAIWA